MNPCQFFVLVLVGLLFTQRAAAADCSTADQVTCLPSAGFAVTDVACLQTAPSTCSASVICNMTKWTKLFTCFATIPCTSPSMSAASCANMYQVCSQSFISQACATSGTGSSTTEAPAATIYSGTLRLSGDWSAIVSDQVKVVVVATALTIDLAGRLGVAVQLTNFALGSLIVSWRTSAVVTNVAAFNTNVAAAKNSSTWLSSTKSAYTSQGGSGTVNNESFESQAGAGGDVSHTSVIAAVVAGVIALAALF